MSSSAPTDWFPPADLPVEQPTKFQLVMKTAQALGLTIHSRYWLERMKWSVMEGGSFLTPRTPPSNVAPD